MTSPIPPIPPEPSRNARGVQRADGGRFQKQMRRIEEVEKVSEAELDKQRKRALKKSIEEESDLEGTESRAPSPFEAEFHLPKPPLGFSELDESVGQEAAPAAPSSQPEPTASAAPSQEENLPESEQFWVDYDLPDQPLQPTQFKEESASKNVDQRSTAEKRESSIFGAKKPNEMKNMPEGALLKKTAEQPFQRAPQFPFQKPFSKTEQKGEPPFASPKGKQGKLEETPSVARKEEPLIPSMPKKSSDEEQEQLILPEAPIAFQSSRSEKEREQTKTKPAAPSIVHPPDPLPPACQKIAEAAQVSASPFLNEQTAALYLRMVGTMAFMAASKGGISQTEVMLNSPAFRNSVFFNSTITLEKYATAPDSFNIRLVGTPEAVQAFSNNVESLSSAFTNAYNEGRILFRVGRIETELAPNRPLIRRKKEGESKDNLK